MSGRLIHVLSVLSVAFMAFAAALVLVGTGVALVFLVLTAVALAGWLWAGDAQDTRDLMSPYLAIAPLFLALSTARFAGGWVGQLQFGCAGWFDPGFVFSDANWFVFLVCTPATLILFGGYLLSRVTPSGHFMAWWAAVFALSEGVIQFIAGLTLDVDASTIIASLLALALIGAGLVLLQRLLHPKAAEIAMPAPLTSRQRTLWALLFIAAVAVYGGTLLSQAGVLPVVIVVGSMLGGMVGWWLTTSHAPADPSWAVPLFLLLLTFFYIHVGEEALTDFNGMISKITGKTWSDDDFLFLIGLLGPVVWFLAAWSLWPRQAFGNFIFWFLIVGMILGEPTHLIVFPLRLMAIEENGYEYASGMYTALFPMIPAILALVRILQDHRRCRSHRQSQPA